MTKELKKQTIANKKWEEKNKEYSSYLKSRSSARSFIKNKATLEDLEQLEEFIKNNKRKSIPLDFFKNYGTMIKIKYAPRIDYIEVIDKLYFGGNKS